MCIRDSYYIDLFSPETSKAFSESDRDITGFRLRHQNAAEKIAAGDRLVCYVTRLSRWIGLLEVMEGPFIDDAPVFVPEHDPFVVRFRVKTLIWLDLERALPIHEDAIWRGLSFTRELEKGSLSWTGKVRGSLVRLDHNDGPFLAQKLSEQVQNGTEYPLDEKDKRKLAIHEIVRADKVVRVSVPEDLEVPDTAEVLDSEVVRESHRIQALLARIGVQMGMSIWIPRNDRGAVIRESEEIEGQLLDRLPLNYDDTTLRTIEQIDVLWLRRRSIVRAFEIEHTTSVYSGILRMADLLALQPNMDIKLHIVAPEAKREKVFQEIRRPVFSLLDRGPLAESCTYLSYDALREVGQLKHLEDMSDRVLDKYSEEAD
jgi:hypothetical protein